MWGSHATMMNRQSSPSNSSSSSTSSPRFSSHSNWSDQSLLLPLSSSFQLPVRYQKIRSSNRRRIVLLFVLSIASLIILFRRRIPKPPRTGIIYEHIKDRIDEYHNGPNYGLNSETSCRLDLSSLQQFNLTEDITYSRRYIRQRPWEHGHTPKAGLSHVEELNEPIFTGFDYLDSTKKGIVDLNSCSPKALPMYLRHQDKPTDASDLVFGLATTSERLLNVTSTMAHWLSDTNAHLIVIIPTGPLVPDVREEMQKLNIRATILTSNEEFLVNYFKLVEAFHTHSSRSKWFTFIDDDTHYFSLERFATILKKYDSRSEHYLGAVTEDFRQARGSGLMAFGGAGATVSRALLERLHQNYYGCLFSQAPWEAGDSRLKKCIYQNTETKLTMIEGLHQVDLIGETVGILEGPRPPINWHHYKSWSQQNVSLISSAGKICGSACLFQRWTFPISDTFGYVSMSLHLGVSIVGYSIGTRPDWGRTEITWANFPDSDFDHSVAPLRMGLIEGRDRFTYRLVGVGHDVDGHVKHTYIKYAEKEQEWFREEARKKQKQEKKEKDQKLADEKAAKIKADMAEYMAERIKMNKGRTGKEKGTGKGSKNVSQSDLNKALNSTKEEVLASAELEEITTSAKETKNDSLTTDKTVDELLDEAQVAVFKTEKEAEAKLSPNRNTHLTAQEAEELRKAASDGTWRKRATATLFDEVLELIYI